MFKVKHISSIIISIIAGALAANCFSVKAAEKLKSKEADSDMPAGVTCYLAGKRAIRLETDIPTLQARLKSLEELYEKGNVQEDVYIKMKKIFLQEIENSKASEKERIFSERKAFLEKIYEMNGNQESYQRQLQMLDLEISYFDINYKLPDDEDEIKQLNHEQSLGGLSQEEYEKQRISILEKILLKDKKEKDKLEDKKTKKQKKSNRQ